MAKQETTIQLRASNRFKRLVEARAAKLGLSMSEYIKQRVLAADGVLREQLWSATPTDDLIADLIKQTQEESQ